jgi:hypothetical protein
MRWHLGVGWLCDWVEPRDSRTQQGQIAFFGAACAQQCRQSHTVQLECTHSSLPHPASGTTASPCCALPPQPVQGLSLRTTASPCCAAALRLTCSPSSPALPQLKIARQERMSREEAMALAELRRSVEMLQEMDASLKQHEQLVRRALWVMDMAVSK